MSVAKSRDIRNGPTYSIAGLSAVRTDIGGGDITASRNVVITAGEELTDGVFEAPRDIGGVDFLEAPPEEIE